MYASGVDQSTTGDRDDDGRKRILVSDRFLVFVELKELVGVWAHIHLYTIHVGVRSMHLIFKLYSAAVTGHWDRGHRVTIMFPAFRLRNNMLTQRGAAHVHTNMRRS